MRLPDIAIGEVLVVNTQDEPIAGMAKSPRWIAVTTSVGQVRGLKRTTEPIWSVTTPPAFTASPAVVNGVVHRRGDSGTFAACPIPGRPIP